jgi:hypothetical protein
MPRRRGAATGVLIVIIGAWCALIPFIGPYFNFTVGPDATWHMTSGRLWLSLLPGVVAVVGGLMLILARNRASAALGAQLAMAAGAWLVIGPEVSRLWMASGTPATGTALGGTDRQVLEMLLYFYATGAAILALAGIAFGRVTARHAGDDERLAAASGGPATVVDPDRTSAGRFTRRRRAADQPTTVRDEETVPADRS